MTNPATYIPSILVQKIHAPAFSRRFIINLAKGLLLSSCVITTGASWAEIHTLESIDFSADSGKSTEIRLHTGSIVPVHKVLSSPSKLIVDIDQINIEGTVQTRFSEKNSISHVIIKPTGEHRARLIIRGEHLAAPSISFDQHTNQNKMSQDSRSRIVSDPDYDNLITTMEDDTFTEPEQETALPVKSLPVPTIKTKPQKKPVEALPASIEAKKTVDSPQKHLLPINDSVMSQLSELSQQVKLSSILSHIQSVIPFIPYAAALLFITVMLYILQVKIRRHLAEQELYSETETEKQSPPWENDTAASETAPSSFRAMKQGASFSQLAKLYKDQQTEVQLTEFSKKIKTREELIGLGGLGIQNKATTPKQKPIPAQKPQPTIKKEKPPAPKTGNPLMDLVAEIQSKNHLAAPVPKAPAKKAAKHYQSQAEKPKVNPAASRFNPKRTVSTDEPTMLERHQAEQVQRNLMEQLRQQELQAKQPINRAAAGQKKITKPNFQSVPPEQVTNRTNKAKQTGVFHPPKNDRNGNQLFKQAEASLPDNPEVLNFLRNVADLMEKEGNTTIAKSIQKNITR